MAISEYFYANKTAISIIRADLKSKIKAGEIFALNLDFCFTSSQVFTKDGRYKKIDMNNRIKSAVDAISRLLEIDDSLFFSHLCQKLVTDQETPFFDAHIAVIEGDTKNVYA